MSGLKDNHRRHNDSLSRLDWREFERLLLVFYRGQGWQVEHVGTAGTQQKFDGGVDLILRRNDEVVLVQCKHWNAKQVPHNSVHELLGIMVNRGATGAILVTSGEFTRAAIEAATRNGHVQLVDGDDLRAMLGELPESVPAIVVERVFGARAGARPKTSGSRRLLLFAVMVVLASIVFQVIQRVAQSAARGAKKQPQAVSAPSRPTVSPGKALTPRIVGKPSKAPPTIQVLTPLESEAQRKRAAEALRIIEKTTPELGARRD